MAEFGAYITVLVDPQQPALVDNFLKQQPKGAKVVSRRIVARGEARAANSAGASEDVFRAADQTPAAYTVFLDLCNADTVEKVQPGIPSSPDEFIERAILAGHPRSLDQFSDPKVEDMLRANFSGDPADLAKSRIAFFNKYLKRASELSEAESVLRNGMLEHVRALVGDKRLLLLKEILSDLEYPDTGLVDEIAEGFKLSGWLSKSTFSSPEPNDHR